MSVRRTKHFRVVTMNAPGFIPCRVCGRITRTQWIKKGKKHHGIWACSHHSDVEVWKEYGKRCWICGKIIKGKGFKRNNLPTCKICYEEAVIEEKLEGRW